FAALVRALLRVVEEGERTDAVLAKRAVVEQHARDDERARERPSPRLVGTGNEPRPEPAIESQQLLAGPLHGHVADLSAATGRLPRLPGSCYSAGADSSSAAGSSASSAWGSSASASSASGSSASISAASASGSTSASSTAASASTASAGASTSSVSSTTSSTAASAGRSEPAP